MRNLFIKYYNKKERVKVNVVEEIKQIQDEIVKWRRDLHQIPEVGFDLPETAKYVANELSKMGIEYKTNMGGTGIVGIIKGEKEGKVIALRADMDALPIKEDTKVEYASTNGNMHACGHDTHAAMLLGAAKILNKHKEELKGSVKLIFQTNEEGAQGAKAIIKDGALENPKIDAVLGLHIGSIFSEVGDGQIGVGYDKIMASFDRFYIKIKGHGCHGAMPHVGVDPVAIAGQVITAFQTIVSREMKPTHPAVVTIGKVNGGTAYNVIPNYVEIEGTFRAVDQKQREMIVQRMEEITAGITKAMRGDYEFEVVWGAPPVINNEEFTKDFVETAKGIIGEENIIELKEPSMGGEDIAYFLNKVPGTFFFLGAFNEEKGIVHPHHTPKFNVDEDVFWKGSALLAQGALDWLNK
jgi:amidohydrolase